MWEFTVTPKLLKDEGVFDGLEYKRRLVFTTNSQPLQVQFLPAIESVAIEWNNSGNKVGRNVEMRRHMTPYGERIVFVCPETDRNCNELCLRDNILASRHYHVRRMSHAERQSYKVHTIVMRLLGLDGTGPARGTSRQTLIAQLRRIPDAVRYDGDVEALLAEGKRVPRRLLLPRRRSVQRYGDYPTLDALWQGEANAWRLSRPDVEALLAAFPETSEPAPKRNLDVANVEDFASLDFPTLTRYWSLKPGELRHAPLIYPSHPVAGLQAVWVIVDVRNAASGRVVLRQQYGDDREIIDQYIRLSVSSPAAPLRWLFVCPITGLRADLLHLRNELFASREAQRLRYRSQGRKGDRSSGASTPST
jgi:hypothetical protein